MPRLRASRLRPDFVVALLLAIAAPSAAGDDAYERGQTAGRVLLTLRSPYGCAIAILNDRCRADFTAYFKDKTDADFKDIPKIGPHPLRGLQAFIEDGDPSGIDPALAYINTDLATAAQWASSAHDAALFDAGSETILWAAAAGSVASEYSAIGPMVDLADHRGRIPPGTLPEAFNRLGATKHRGSQTKLPSNIRDVTAVFVVELNQRYPPAQLLAFAPRPGLRADALDGVAFSTLAELIDNPSWLAQADAQSFALALLGDLPSDSPELTAQSEACRRAVTIANRFDHDAANKACVVSTTSYVLALPLSRRRAFFLGTAAAQIAYNAAVLRNGPSAAEYLHVLSAFDDLDATLPAFATARVRAKTVASTDWANQFLLSLQLVHSISNA